MHVLVQREDLRDADDAGSIKVRRFEVSDAATVVDFLRRVRTSNLVPNLAGGRATWVVEGDRPLAVLTQEYREPWALVGANVRLVEVAGRLPRPHVGLRYFAQRSPEDVFREFGGDPVRLGREAFEASHEISWREAFESFFRPRR